MLVHFISWLGGGTSSRIEIDEGTTLGEFLGQAAPEAEARKYNIRVNRKPAGVRLPTPTRGHNRPHSCGNEWGLFRIDRRPR